MTLARNRRKRKSINKNTKSMKTLKRVIFILQSKGGAGKSVFAYNIANILKRAEKPAYYFDFDNESKSSISQLKFVNIKPFDLINPLTKVIDRSKMNSFLDNIADEERAEIVVCDFGAASSQQFLMYAESKEGRAVLASFKDEIQIEIHCVVSGNNSYPACADYCEALFDSTHGVAQLFLAQNQHESFSNAQTNDIERMLEKFEAKLLPFNITMENGDSDVSKIKVQMYNGLNSFDIKARSTKLVYNLMLDEMNFPL